MEVDRSDSVEADDAFSLLGDETRLAIVRELGDAWSPEDRESPSFSALRRAVGTEDSGRFEYHLGKLRGTYVERTDDGYGLTYTGVRVYQTLRAGTFNERPRVESLALAADCLHCDGPLEASYEDHLFRIECLDCEHHFYDTFLPPGQVIEADAAETLATLDRAVRHDVSQAAAGVCPSCTGSMSVAVGPDVGYIFAEKEAPFAVHVAYDCSLCGSHFESPVGEALIQHPAFVSFFYERGVDLTDRHVWTLPFVHDPERTTVRSTDPLRVGVTARHGDDAVTVVVDGTLSVVAVEETRVADPS